MFFFLFYDEFIIIYDNIILYVYFFTSQCSVSCGTGMQYREIVCLATVNDEFVVLPTNNCSDSKPINEQICRTSPCSPEWFTSDWSTVKVQKLFLN